MEKNNAGQTMTQQLLSVQPHRQDPQNAVCMTWKLRGTGKKARREVIARCSEGQHVFIICDSNGANCMAITDKGEEIGRLSKRDEKIYHDYVEKRRVKIYIKRIRERVVEGVEKPVVKIKLFVREREQITTEHPQQTAMQKADT